MYVTIEDAYNLTMVGIDQQVERAIKLSNGRTLQCEAPEDRAEVYDVLKETVNDMEGQFRGRLVGEKLNKATELTYKLGVAFKSARANMAIDILSCLSRALG